MDRAALSVIVTTRNEERNLPRLFASLRANDVPVEHVIVIDASSSDTTPDIVRQFGARYFLGAPNLSVQRNIGVRQAATPYVMILDADMEMPAGYIDEVLDLFSQGHECVILPELSVAKSFLSRARGFERLLQEGDLTIEAARAFSTDLFWRCGGYDEEIGFGGEDWFLAKTMYERVTPVRVRKKILHHEGDPSVSSIARKFFFYGRGRYRLFKADRKRFVELTNPVRPSTKKHAGVYLGHPLMALGVVAYKVLTYGSGAAGFVAEALQTRRRADRVR